MKILIRLGRPDAIQRAIDNGYDISSKDSLLGRFNILTSTFVFYKYPNIRDYFVKRNINNLEKITYEMLKVLLKNGADPNMIDEHGMAPIHYAMDLLTKENQIMILDLLIEHGAEIDLKDKYGNTPLHLATRKYPIMIVQKLLTNGANINIKNNKGKTPLDLAIKYGWEEIIENLREHGGKTAEDLKQEASMGNYGQPPIK